MARELLTNRYHWLIVVLVQVFLVPLFISLACLWSPPGGCFYKPNDPALLSMLPGIFDRYYVACIVSGLTLAAFLILTRRNEQMLMHELFIITGISCFFYVLVLTRMLQYPVPADDAYQNYRYVYNWINHLSLYYNFGERILGFTSSLDVVILAIACFLFDRQNIPIVSQTVTTIWQAITYLLLFLLAKRLFSSEALAVLVAALYATNALILAAGMTGKEASLVTLLVALSLFFLSRENYRCFAWASSLLALARPEGIIWLILAVAWSLKKLGRAALSLWISPMCFLVIWQIVLLIYFGTIIPHGPLARAAMYYQYLSAKQHSMSNIVYWLGEYTFQGLISNICSLFVGLNIALVLQGFIALSALGLVSYKFVSHKNEWLRFYFYAVVWLLGFFSLIYTRACSWYYAWFALVPIILIVFAVDYIARFSKTTKSALFCVIATMVIGCQINHYIMLELRNGDKSGHPVIADPFSLRDFKSTLASEITVLASRVLDWNPSDERLLLYKRAIDYIRMEGGSNRIIATREPGALGFFNPTICVLDLGGLISEQPMKYFPVPVNQRSPEAMTCISPQAVNDLKPDFLCTLDHFARNGLLKNPRFLSNYKLLNFWPITIWTKGVKGIFLFQKVLGH